MNYPLKPKPRKNANQKTANWVVGLFFCLIVLVYISGNRAFSVVLGPIASPFWHVRESVVGFFVDHGAIWKSKETLLAENATLRERIAEVSALQVDRDALLHENSALKGLIEGGEQGEVARILTNPSQSFYDIVTVELKTDSSVRVGDRVYGNHDTAIGTVLDRTGTLARIEYYSRGGVQTDAQLEKNGTSMMIEGLGGGSFLFVAPRGLDVSAGDTVVLPALHMSILGTVQAVENIRTDSFKNVYISYPFNIFSLSYVRITHAR